MKFNRKLLLFSFTVLFLIALVWNAWLYQLPAKDTTWNYLYNLMYGAILFFGSVTAIIYAISYNLKTSLGKMLFFFGLELLFFALGNVLWIYYNFILKIEVPYGSLADIMYGLCYLSLFIGTYFLIKIYQPLVNKKLLVVTVVNTFLVFIIIFGFFIKPEITDDLSLIQKIITIAYPTSDAVIIAFALIALQISGGRLHYSLYIVALGLLFLGVGDLLYTYRVTAGIYWNGDIADLIFTFHAYFLSIGLFEIINNLQQAKVELRKPNEIS